MHIATPRARGGAPTAWTRPQQLATAAYGIWAAALTTLLVIFLENPAHTDQVARQQGYSPVEIAQRDQGYHAGWVLVAVECVVYLGLAALAWRGVRWSFWPCLLIFGFCGLGAVWVPLRPAAHQGMDTTTMILHAGVTDLPGLLLAVWLVAGMVRFGRPWATRSMRSRAAACGS